MRRNRVLAAARIKAQKEAKILNVPITQAMGPGTYTISDIAAADSGCNSMSQLCLLGICESVPEPTPAPPALLADPPLLDYVSCSYDGATATIAWNPSTNASYYKVLGFQTPNTPPQGRPIFGLQGTDLYNQSLTLAINYDSGPMTGFSFSFTPAGGPNTRNNNYWVFAYNVDGVRSDIPSEEFFVYHALPVFDIWPSATMLWSGTSTRGLPGALCLLTNINTGNSGTFTEDDIIDIYGTEWPNLNSLNLDTRLYP